MAYNIENIIKSCPLLPDLSVREYKAELLDYLKHYHAKYSTHSMNDGALTLRGEKEMLGTLITLIEEN